MMNSVLAFLVRYRIAGGVLLVPLYLWFARPRWWSISAGFAVAMVGILIRLWASGYITKRQQLTTTGPYSLVRNPLYLGSFIIGLGACVMGLHLGVAVMFLLLFMLIYHGKMADEEAHLKERYGVELYETYQRRVPRLIPRLARPEPGGGFDWRLVFKHREYQLWLAIGAVLMFLSLKVVMSG